MGTAKDGPAGGLQVVAAPSRSGLDKPERRRRWEEGVPGARPASKRAPRPVCARTLTPPRGGAV